MKKIIIYLIAAFFILAIYTYQKPTLTTGEAIAKAVEYINDPPEGWTPSNEKVDLENIHSESISTYLVVKPGFLNELTNRRVWHVTITNGDQFPMVILDAITGEFIELYGPLN